MCGYKKQGICVRESVVENVRILRVICYVKSRVETAQKLRELLGGFIKTINKRPDSFTVAQ